MKAYEIPAEKTYWKFDTSEYNFNSTAELKPPKDPIDIVKGQKMAKEAVLTAIEAGGNVIFIGPPGCGKSLLAKTIAEQYAKDLMTKEGAEIELEDQLLVYNFDTDDDWEPKALALPKGQGKQLKADMKNLLKSFQKGKYDVDEAYELLNESAGDPKDLRMKITDSSGDKYEITVGEIVDHYVKTPGQAGELYSRIKKELERGESILDIPVFSKKEDPSSKKRSLREIFGKEGEKIELANRIPGYDELTSMLDTYKETAPEAGKYIKQAIADLADNYGGGTQEDSRFANMRPGGMSQGIKLNPEDELKYLPNLIVDNSETEGIPIQYIENPSVQNFAGEAGHDALNRTPGHARIKAGKLVKANGGIAVVDELIKVIRDDYMKDFLLTTLQEKKVRIGGGGGKNGGTSSGIESQPVKADCRIIGCANEDLMAHLTPKISRRFEYKVVFDSCMDNTKENREAYAEIIAYEINKYNENPKNPITLPHFSKEAVGSLVETGVSLAQSYAHGRDKLSNIIDPIGRLAISAGIVANKAGSKTVRPTHIKAAKEKRDQVSRQYAEASLNAIYEGRNMIGTKGERVGVVNGLSVSRDDYGLMSFGLPLRLISTASEGNSGIADIERAAGLTGKDYAKAFGTVKSYFDKKYSQKAMSKCAATMSFPQVYSAGKDGIGIDGDSASIATVVSLTSAISELPVKQNYAMTGSMNLLGEVQPIGGVNEKIKGFYEVCKHRRLTGDQGVIIPYQNVGDLMLDENIVTDIKKGKFHVYAVKNIDDVLSTAMGKPVKEIHAAVNSRLQTYQKA